MAEIVFRTAFRPGIRLSMPGSRSKVSLPLEFSVIDNGPGVPEDMLPYIFDPFVTSKTQRYWPRSCTGRQDHRRPWRGHRMRIAAAADRLPHPDARAYGRAAGRGV